MISAPVGDQEMKTVHLKEKRVRKKIQITSEWKQTNIAIYDLFDSLQL